MGGHHQGQNAFGCAKLIGFPAEGAGQVHGCPFKQLDMLSLRNKCFSGTLRHRTWTKSKSSSTMASITSLRALSISRVNTLAPAGAAREMAWAILLTSSIERVADFTRRKTKPRMRKRPRRTLQSLSPQCKVPSVRVASVCFSLTGAVRTWGIIRGVSSALNLRAGSNEKRCVQKKKKKKKKKRAPKKKKKKKKKKS